MNRIIKEITPIKNDDLFIVLNHQDAKFDYPIHCHPEFELNLIFNCCGERIVGDSKEKYVNSDLVLVGPNIPHVWNGKSKGAKIQVVTIQFHQEFIDTPIVNKQIMSSIKNLLHDSKQGVLFSKADIELVKDRIFKLSEYSGFNSLLIFLSIIFDLSVSTDKIKLTSLGYNSDSQYIRSKRINKVHKYIQQNLQSNIRIRDLAGLINMNDSAFSHFFKKRTQRSFSEYLINMRIGLASRLLMETSNSVSEICFECGFNNISNFNRMFKKVKKMTPTEFRSQQLSITAH